MLAASALLVAALAMPAPSSATETDVLVVGKAGDADNLDPAVTMTNNSWTATYPAYERLVRFKVENGRGMTEVEGDLARSEEHTSELQSLMRISYAVFCLKKQNKIS